jgi:DNA-binding transcriptional MerR regulator
MYTVKQLSALAGVSVRALHHYDEIKLLSPTQVGANRYRYYDDAALLRLQQILFYREIGLELAQIKDVLDAPGFDLIDALQSHRAALQGRIGRLEKLVETIDETISAIKGGMKMSKKRLFEAFSDEKQKDYERSARLQYGPDLVNESARRWGNYTAAERQQILDEGNQIYAAVTAAIEAGESAGSAEVQALIARWHDHIRYFYEPTLDILRGLGALYNEDPAFNANFKKIHPELAEFMRAGINTYVDALETAAIAQMLADDADDAAAGPDR